MVNFTICTAYVYRDFSANTDNQRMDRKLFERRFKLSTETTPGTELHLLIEWWIKEGKQKERTEALKCKHMSTLSLVTVKEIILFFTVLEEQLNDISLDRHQIENVFSFTNDVGQTALHLSVLHRMPEEFIIAMVLKMEQYELDKQDASGYRAIDYLVGETAT